MQKPEYMEIIFPAELKDFRSAVQKYFLGLKTQNVKVRFSEIRRRKDFDYQISFVCNETKDIGLSNKKKSCFRVEFLKDNTKK